MVSLVGTLITIQMQKLNVKVYLFLYELKLPIIVVIYR